MATRANPPGSQPQRYVWGVIALIVVALGLWFLPYLAEERAIRDLNPKERRALYERTLRTLESPCSSKDRSAVLDEFCSEQAKFILKFPECDATCEGLASAHRPAPVR